MLLENSFDACDSDMRRAGRFYFLFGWVFLWCGVECFRFRLVGNLRGAFFCFLILSSWGSAFSQMGLILLISMTSFNVCKSRLSKKVTAVPILPILAVRPER